MTDTIDLGNGRIADREPWEALLRLIEELFPDDRFDDDAEDAKFREAIRDRLSRGGFAVWLGKDRGCDQDELMKLKRCDEAAALCNIRRPDTRTH